MATSKGGLGKGLSALFGDLEELDEIKAYDEEGNLAEGVNEIDIDQIDTNPDQPRKFFDDVALRELAASISNFGILQPLLVRPKNGRYIIIAGERRFRAAKIAGLKKVPALVREISDKEQKEIALIENLQRENLNPIEEAIALQALIEEYGITQEQLAVRLGKSRPTITNTLRLLMLDDFVMDLVRNGRLSAGHARALVIIKDKDVQLSYAKAACDNKMSVRELELMVNAYMYPKKKEEKPKKEAQSRELKDLVNDMQRIFATKVKIIGNDDKGRIYIDYYTRDDIQRIFDLMGVIKDGKEKADF